MSSPSNGIPAAKRAKPAPFVFPSWTLQPLKKGEKGPIEGPEHPPRGKIHEDFTQLRDILNTIITGTDDFFFEVFDKDIAEENYNTPMEGSRRTLARIILTQVRDFLYDYVYTKRGGVLKTRSHYTPHSCFVSKQSSFLEKWIPVIEEHEEYGKLTEGNFTAFIMSIAKIAFSDDPCKTFPTVEMHTSL